MGMFEELMNQYRNPGEDGLPADHLDALANAYTEDLSIRDAAVQERETQLTEKDSTLAAKDAEINRLKAVNYDLLIAAPKTGDPSPNNDPSGNAGEKRGIESLFED